MTNEEMLREIGSLPPEGQRLVESFVAFRGNGTHGLRCLRAMLPGKANHLLGCGEIVTR